jgi:hypothetical protein
MGGSPAPQTQSTTYQLSPEQRKLMDLAMPGVTQFAASTPQRYNGTTIANFDPSQTGGQNTVLQGAGTQTALGASGADTTQRWLSPDALNVNNNPAVQGMLDANRRSVETQLMETALPGIRDSAVGTGNFGSSRQGIAEGVAIGKGANALADANSRTLSAAYDTNVNSQLKALGLLPQTTANVTTGGQTQSAVGDVRQAFDQAKLSEQVGNFNYDQLAPFLQSKEIMSLLTGLPGGTTTSTASTPQKNPITGALGGAAAGASLGSFLGPMGTAGGAGLGALLSFL